jgi:glucosamine--fructose-6-phosphate aminotransferase (isomerizing)
MCGIIGYVGQQKNGIEKILNGLNLVLYRGYDSIGAAFFINNEVRVYKKASKNSTNVTVDDIRIIIPNIEEPCYLGIGHTRWATRGKVTDVNAHPHWDEKGEFFVVHNGNVENFSELKKELIEKGVKFISETDTELITHLIAREYNGDLTQAAERAMGIISGANAFLVISPKHPDTLVAVNRGGSLLICQNSNGIMVASDPIVFREKKAPYISLGDNELAVLTPEKAIVKRGDEIIEKEKITTEEEEEKLSKGAFDHFMFKEIMEQSQVLANAISGRFWLDKGIAKLGGIEEIARDLRKVPTFHFIGCGTAYNACCYGKLLFNRFGIPAQAWIASEFCYSHPVFSPRDAFIFVSQSGETADTIAVLEEILLKGNLCLGIVNKPGTKIPRLTDAGVFIRVGPEIGVASTKAFTGQMINIVLLALFLARQRNMTIDTGQKIIHELQAIPEKVGMILNQAENIKKLTGKFNHFRNYYFLGRYFSSVVAQEGALKLKEIAYVHAEAYPLGEMKHGPLALVAPEFCSIVIAPNDSVLPLSRINIDEIKSRHGPVIAVTTEGCSLPEADEVIYVPETLEYFTPLLTTIPCQLFSYYMARQLNLNPDTPRNLAKSVTVQ